MSVDSWRRIEKNIFLILRPNAMPYNVLFDLNGGTTEDIYDLENYLPGEIPALPEFIPTKDNHQFLYWTSEKDNNKTRIQDLYFYSYNDNEIHTVYAYYQECLNIHNVINIGEEINFKDNTYAIKIDYFEYLDSYYVETKKGEVIEKLPSQDSKMFLLSLTIIKNKSGNDHKLDNNDDFYLENDYVGLKVNDYFGYIKNFKSIKPIDDYKWIGLKLSDVGEYKIVLLFEINENLYLENDMLFLEIDFFKKQFAKSIYLR